MPDVGISIIIPLFNKELTIKRAVKSALAQTYSSIELIIVDDGSTDESLLIAKTFSDARIRLYTKDNEGVSSARNFGIKKSSFDLIAFLDADDWWEPNFLSTLFDLSKRYPMASVYGGQYMQLVKKSDHLILDRFPPIKEGYFELYDFLFALSSSSILIKKAAFDECGYFDEQLTHGEDIDMWIRLSFNHLICYTSEVIAYCDITGNPLTTSRGKRIVLEHHFLSKIDKYIGKKGEKWDKALLKRKIKYLDGFYVREPFNKEVRKLIRDIPKTELNYIQSNNLRRNHVFIILKSLLFNLYKKLEFCYNKLILANGNLK